MTGPADICHHTYQNWEGTLLRSGRINAKSIKFICDNSAAILAPKRDLTQSIFHRTEGDHNLIATMKYIS
jgi:hypothetical protein